jgi:hypothetical protein
MLRRIASTSMEQLAAFLTAPEAAPGTAPSIAEPQVAMAPPAESSPEAAGIFRASRPDPVQRSATDRAPLPAATSEDEEAVTLSASAH